MIIKPYTPEYENTVIKLWQRCNLTRPWNNPKLDIERMLKVYPELFLIGLIDGRLVGTVMGGYEGHRGWVYYLAVDPDLRRQGLGRQMMAAIEEKLLAKGYPKINVQVRRENTEALSFYDKIGYKIEDRISLGKRLIED